MNIKEYKCLRAWLIVLVQQDYLQERPIQPRPGCTRSPGSARTWGSVTRCPKFSLKLHAHGIHLCNCVHRDTQHTCVSLCTQRHIAHMYVTVHTSEQMRANNTYTYPIIHLCTCVHLQVCKSAQLYASKHTCQRTQVHVPM